MPALLRTQKQRESIQNKIPLSKKQSEIIAQLPKVLDRKEKKILEKLLGKQIVLKEELTKIPSSLEEARFCKSCAANDFIIPGLEFKDGLCPLCQTQHLREELKSVLPLVQEIPKAKKSRFDVGLFYTGGNAKLSIENAKKRFPNVEFVSKKINDDDLRKIYRKLYVLSENTCACPALAYVLFYPDLVENKVGYFIAGNEPAQRGQFSRHRIFRFSYAFSFLKKLIKIETKTIF